MTEITYREAITRALADELEADDSVFLLGEDIGAAGGVFRTTTGLQERFGERRVRDTPIAETAIVGAAVGAAAMGLKPVAEIMFADFSGVCFDQIANQLPKYRYMTGGQLGAPATIRLANGANGGYAAQHSQAVENWFLSVAGLKICVPGTPADAYGLLRSAIQDPDPVLFFEHKGLYNSRGPGFEAGATVPLGVAEVVRPGRDVTIVATQLMRHRAVEAAALLAAEGVEAELIDPRTLVPLDLETIGASVDRTNHLVIVQESTRRGGWGASVIDALLEDRFESLDAAPVTICGDETPIPYARSLEDAWLPSPERIAGEVRALLERSRG